MANNFLLAVTLVTVIDIVIASTVIYILRRKDHREYPPQEEDHSQPFS